MTDHDPHHHHHHDHDHDHEHHHEHEHSHEHHHDHDHDHEHHHVELSPEQYIEAYRAAKDEWMREDPHSPLPEDRRETFQGLSYYPFDERFFLALPLNANVSKEEPVTLETSTGDSREYHRAGKIRFEVDGDEAELTVYQGPDGELFLPLRDGTSGKETYGAGRYLEPELIEDGSVLVDLNGLYNPFCAYDERYSCPLPPRENWIRVPIQAGEKVPEQE